MGMPRYDSSTLVTLGTTKGQRVSHPWASRACGGVTRVFRLELPVDVRASIGRLQEDPMWFRAVTGSDVSSREPSSSSSITKGGSPPSCVSIWTSLLPTRTQKTLSSSAGWVPTRRVTMADGNQERTDARMSSRGPPVRSRDVHGLLPAMATSMCLM